MKPPFLSFRTCLPAEALAKAGMRLPAGRQGIYKSAEE